VLEQASDQPFIYAAVGRVWLAIARARDDGIALNKALEALAHVGASDTATSEALTLYGEALLESKRPDLAEAVLLESTKRFPVEPEAFVQYAKAAEEQHHLTAARTALIQYGRLLPQDRDTSSRAAHIGALSMQLKDFDGAIEWFTRALERSPDEVPLLLSLAEAQLSAGDRSGADTTLARGLAKHPENAALLALARRVP
jgi:predicted Zn-dependent protease